MVDTQALRDAFAARLHEALDGVDGVRKERGRNVDLHALLVKKGFESSKQATHKWLRGESLPEKDHIHLLAEVLRVRPGWLEYGEEPRLPEDGYDIRDTELEHAYQPDRTHRYPVINEVTAGGWTEICDSFTPDDTVEMQETTTDAGRCGFWLRVKNDSMTAQAGKSFPEGMLILVSPDREVLPGSFVVARVKGTNEATFKQYIQDASGHYLKPLNPSYNMIPLTDKCHFVGRVIEAKWADL